MGEKFTRTDTGGNKFRCAEDETITMPLVKSQRLEAKLKTTTVALEKIAEAMPGDAFCQEIAVSALDKGR